MIVALNYKTPELIKPLESQCSVKWVEVESFNIKKPFMRISKNLFWTGNWDFVLRTLHLMKVKWAWMLNDDITGASEQMYQDLLEQAEREDLFMITPSFNSPHPIFREPEDKEVSWVDMTAPLINVSKYIELGGFDLQFKGYGADLDLCYRAKLAGFKMKKTTHSINHIGGYTVAKNNAWEQSDMTFEGKILRKHGKHWTEL